MLFNKKEKMTNNFYNLNVLNYGEDKYIKSKEYINPDVLNFIVENEDKFKDLLREDKRIQFIEGDDYDPSAVFTMARNYLRKSRNGIIDVEYKQKNGVGRFNAICSLSLQNITRQIRQSIAKDTYMDIDIKNCHPNILLFICENLNINCDILKKYCNNRDEFFRNNNLTKDVGKIVILSVINGGVEAYKNVENPSDDLMDFYENEIKNIHNVIASKHKDKFKIHQENRVKMGKTYNHKASFMNIILCDIENMILQIMREYFGFNEREVLCFDGIMLPIGNTLPFKDCEKMIFDRLKINVELSYKPFEEYFDLTNYTIPKYIEIDNDRYEKYLSIKRLMKQYIKEDDVNNNSVSIIFNKMVGNDLITINENGDGFMWDNDKKLWLEKTANELMVEICNENNLILRLGKEIAKEYSNKLSKINKKENPTEWNKINMCYNRTKKLSNDIQTTRYIKDVFTLAKNKFRQDKFKTETINRNHSYLPIQDGKIINLKTGEIRDRLREDYFSISCDINYIDEKDLTIEDIEINKKFVNQIFMEDEEYINYKQIKLGSYLCGDKCRDIDINHGCGKNGKSTMINALKIMMGEFVGFIGKDVIVFDKSQHRKKGGGNHTSHLVPIDGKRLIITQELEENDTIDSEIVKKIASGDPIEGVRECFGKKTYTVYPFCKLIVSSNKIPKFDVNDMAITDRLVFNPYKSRFLNKEAMIIEKENNNYDPSKYKYYDADDILIEKFNRLGREINVLFSWLVKGCIKFYEVKNDGIKKPSIVKEYINEKTNENDVIGLWISECCDVKTKEEFNLLSKIEKKEYETSCNELYNNFSNWATMNDCHKGLGKIDFNKRLEVKFTKTRNNKLGMIFNCIKIFDEDNNSNVRLM